MTDQNTASTAVELTPEQKLEQIAAFVRSADDRMKAVEAGIDEIKASLGKLDPAFIAKLEGIVEKYFPHGS